MSADLAIGQLVPIWIPSWDVTTPLDTFLPSLHSGCFLFFCVAAPVMSALLSAFLVFSSPEVVSRLQAMVASLLSVQDASFSASAAAAAAAASCP